MPVKIYAERPGRMEVMQYTTSAGQDNDDLYAFLNELVDFDAMVWFNHGTRTWEPFAVGDVFVRPLGTEYVHTSKMDAISLDDLWEPYNG